MRVQRQAIPQSGDWLQEPRRLYAQRMRKFNDVEQTYIALSPLDPTYIVAMQFC
jgi:hypothetical protein